jgi:hypothetical protein
MSASVIDSSSIAGWNWSPATYLNDSTVWNPVVTPNGTVEYKVTATNIHGCSGHDTVLVIYSSLPTVLISDDTAICVGGSAQLQASGSGNPGFAWTPLQGLSCSNCSNPLATPNLTITYTVTVQDTLGCLNDTFVTITVLPVPSMQVSADTSVCDGGTAILTVSGALSYSWNPGGMTAVDHCGAQHHYELYCHRYWLQWVF